MNPPVELRRERDFGQKINATFQFATQNAKPLIRCLLYLVAPVALVAGVVGGLYQSRIFSFMSAKPIGVRNTDPMGQIYAQFFSPDYWAFAVLLTVSGVVLTLTVCAFLAEYEASGNRPPSVPQVWQRVRRHLPTGLGLAALATLLILFSFLLLIIPGIYVAVALSLSFMVLVQENVSVGFAISRPFTLISGKWWSTFGLLLVMYFIAGIVGYIFQLPTAVLSGLKLLQVLPVDLTLGFIFTTIISTLGTTLLQSLVVLAAAFQYYNLVEKKEGVGLLNSIRQIGQATPNPATSHEQGDF